MNPNYYEILGVLNNASFSEIHSNYRKLALQFHPDKSSSCLSQEMMKQINEAYFVLSNPVKRAQYDQNQNIFEAKTSQNQSKKDQKSVKSVWIRQFKEIVKGLQKLWFQYLEFQKKNQTKQKNQNSEQSFSNDEFHCMCHHHCNCDFKHHKKQKKKKNSKQKDLFENSWNYSNMDDDFLKDMFGFGYDTKK